MQRVGAALLLKDGAAGRLPFPGLPFLAGSSAGGDGAGGTGPAACSLRKGTDTLRTPLGPLVLGAFLRQQRFPSLTAREGRCSALLIHF